MRRGVAQKEGQCRFLCGFAPAMTGESIPEWRVPKGVAILFAFDPSSCFSFASLTNSKQVLYMLLHMHTVMPRPVTNALPSEVFLQRAEACSSLTDPLYSHANTLFLSWNNGESCLSSCTFRVSVLYL